jgi:orotate phosphoribosyltransferase
LKKVFNPKRLKKVVARAAKKIKKLQKTLKFDAIAFRGQSGAGIAYPVSMVTGIPLIHVRKETCKGTHGQPVEGPNYRVKRYVILDDFIGQGTTVNTIIKKIDRQCRQDDLDPMTCVGILLYDNCGDREHEDHRLRAVRVYSV